MTERTYSNRGFAQHQPIKCGYGGEIRVYESSAASAPHIWVNITESERLAGRDAAVHLTIDAARQLVLDLTDLIENHYQNDGA